MSDGAGVEPAVQALLAEAFPRSEYTESFPTVFRQGNPERHVSLMREGRLVAFCALRSFYWKTPDALVHGVCIGSVCTSKELRGQGLGREIVGMATRDAARLGADFAFLFSDLDSFYRKCGFTPAGTERLAPLQLSARAGTPSRDNAEIVLASLRARCKAPSGKLQRLPFAELARDLDFAARLWRFLTRHSLPCESLLGFSEFRDLLTIPATDAFLLWEHDELEAFCFLGKGADFQEVLHGWVARKPHRVLELAARILEQNRKRSLLFLVPPDPNGPWQDLAAASNSLLYWCPLDKATLPTAALLESGALYPRTLQSI